MSKLYVPAGYSSVLNLYQTQRAISLVKRTFEDSLSLALNLKRVSAPLFVEPSSGLNDDLNGIERAVTFDIAETGTDAQIVHSLAKWKRMALGKYGFGAGEGLYTDMNAIRRDEEMDNLHSIYVDQWDWELVIERKDRTEKFLKDTVCRIVNSICDTADVLHREYPMLKNTFCREVSFITAQELEDMYPNLNSKQRENAYTREHKTVFIMQIGGVLRSGKKHDGRAPDYDDWTLNGDLLFWSDILDCAVEVSSMGIRVDAASLDAQLKKSGCDDRRQLWFHKMLLEDKLPLTIGGGIGQSRLCLLLTEKVHVGEVQVSIWDEKTKAECKEKGISLL